MAIGNDEVKGEIALELDVDKISSADFMKAAKAFLGLMKEAGKEVDGGMPSDAWLISVNEGSQVINAYPNTSSVTPESAAHVAGRVLDAISCLDSSSENPFGENDRAIEHIKALSALSSRDKNRISVRCLSKTKSSAFNARTYNHSSQILSWEYEDIGTVDGVLDVVSAKRGLEFKIREILHGHTVKCIVNEELMEKALGCFRKRVEVEGVISYNKKGLPVVVKAKTMNSFPPENEIPHFSELKGILKDS